MPQTPDDLSRIIREMAAKQAQNRGKKIDGKALDRIGEIPAPFSNQKTIVVDLGQLEGMISDIIELASKHAGDTIDLPALEKALIEVKCHYLWFC